MCGQIVYGRLHGIGGPKHLEDVAACYQEVFATEPWREWRRCSACGEHWGMEQGAEVAKLNFIHCGQPMQEYWPRDQVAADLARELSLPGATGWRARDRDIGKLVGFCHGYPVAADAFDGLVKLPGVAETIQRRFGGKKSIAYQDEIGVLKEYRGRGIAGELFRLRLCDFRSLGLEVCAVRTMTKPPTVTFQWYSALGYEVVGEYGDEGGRVVMACSMKGLA